MGKLAAAWLIVAFTAGVSQGQQIDGAGAAAPDPSSGNDVTASTEQLPDRDPRQEGPPVFRGELEISLIDLFVSVVDSEGDPVAGLHKDDFEVFENGQQVEITNFQAITRGELKDADVGSADNDRKSAMPQGQYVVILFDNPSLERRTRKRALKAIEGFLDQGLARGDQFMIAVNSGRFEIVKPFTTSEPGLKAALRSVAETGSGGDALKKQKRYLKRTVYAEDIYTVSLLPGQSNSIASASAVATATRLLTQIEAVRRTEYNRINQSLSVTNELMQALAGVEGRKSILWIGEDLALRPMLDVYTVYYSKVEPLSRVMTVDLPDIWGSQLALDRQFAAVAASAQAAGATIYILDASDRDREMASADFGASGATSFLVAESTGSTWSPGTDFAQVRQRTEGGGFISTATGGEAFGNTRDVPKIMDTLSEYVSTYYYLGYRRSGPPDGKRHDVQVKVIGSGVQVRHHEQVLDRTAPQRLADLAMSRLWLNLGDNELNLAVNLKDPEPLDDDTFVLPLQLTMPVEDLVLLPDSGNHIGQILVAVAVLDDEGKTAPVHLVRLRLTIPSDRLSEGAIASQPLRLKMKRGSLRIAVGVRDEVSGIQASVAASVAAAQEL